MKINDMDVGDLADVVAKALDEATELLLARIAALEQRPSLEYRGIFQHTTDYKRGSCVTHKGSLWIAVMDTHATLGLSTDESRAWVLAVKAGRDARAAHRRGDDDER